jgi:A/G-specific adenine glycosylase
MTQVVGDGLSQAQVLAFRRKLMQWYRTYARKLPWRGITDPYCTWVSEVMLQQTRVAAVLEHYARFLLRFPDLNSLALAPEAEVLAAWSGLGYYRRARMLHKAAQFVAAELGGHIPQSSAALRTLPGVGEYTCAAIASIAFGESIAVVDGNVERVLLRLSGRPEDVTAAGKKFVRDQAALLVPARRSGEVNLPGDHNQAMMELGATICLPKAPLCLHCPVFSLCSTRGEHVTAPRGRQTSRPAAFLLATRKQGTGTEVLLERRGAEASLMPGMLELPPLPLDAVEGREPLINLRHSITSTNYYVGIYVESTGSASVSLRDAVPASSEALAWYNARLLHDLPLTGLARKVLRRVDLWSVTGPESPEAHRVRHRAAD